MCRDVLLGACTEVRLGHLGLAKFGVSYVSPPWWHLYIAVEMVLWTVTIEVHRMVANMRFL